MLGIRQTITTIAATGALILVLAGTGWADAPVGPARYVPCPPPTGDARLYQGVDAPFRRHSAVVEPLGNVVVLREGRSDAGPRAFGWLHALIDHNVADHTVERVVSSAYPLTAPRGRVRYIAELRVEGYGVMSVWVEVDPSRSGQAPDTERFGVVTAYCKLPSNANPENKCPDWVNESLL